MQRQALFLLMACLHWMLHAACSKAEVSPVAAVHKHQYCRLQLSALSVTSQLPIDHYTVLIAACLDKHWYMVLAADGHQHNQVHTPLCGAKYQICCPQFFSCTHNVNCASALQVVCAGVWHNAVLCALCWLCALLLPLLLMPMYTTGTGAVVRYSQCVLC